MLIDSQLTVAAVVFVKTPGFSPLKTRLAKSIGKEKAEEFYQQSVKSIEEVLLTAKKQFTKIDINLNPIWSIAESDALDHSLWGNHDTILQSTGGLGERLHNTYQELYKKFDVIIFLGADAPQITSKHLIDAVTTHKETNNFVIGPAKDGGYYLFCGPGCDNSHNNDIPKSTWLDVSYSQETTLLEFKKNLKKLKAVSLLTPLSDVDTKNELIDLKNYFSERSTTLLPKQTKLYNWLQENI